MEAQGGGGGEKRRRGEEQEKRFHSIMEKLFSPPPTPTTTSNSLALPSTSSSLPRGIKRPKPATSSSPPPHCRPWDRLDLMRRVSTFKSMTWFAKPQVVSAVNCARRGWVNVDIDILACEACGARLLFSTPSSWSQQQVEKAALVFSLKLESGHKLLCPWIDNACDERLAEFPPTTPQLLVDSFRQRFFLLLQLVALPVISSSAIRFMKSPQLDEFLKQSPSLDYQNEGEADSSSLYYQAQKLISLCGWEPRSLPYIVDCKDMMKHLGNNAVLLNSSEAVSNKQNQGISPHSTFGKETLGADRDYWSHSEQHTDPNSVVLDCCFCGAIVGLWTFSTIPRPLEHFRLVGDSEPTSEKNSGQATDHDNHVDGRRNVTRAGNGTLGPLQRSPNLNLSIAGGPPPTKQKFKATISFPVIGRNLRARLSYDSDSEFRDHTCNNQVDTEPASNNKNLHLEEGEHIEEGVVEQVPQPESATLSKDKTQDPGQCSNLGGYQSSFVNQEVIADGAALGEGKNADVNISCLLGGGFSPMDASDFLLDFPTEGAPDTINGNDQLDMLLNDPQSFSSFNSSEGGVHCSQVGTSTVSEHVGNVSIGNDKSSSDNLLGVHEKGQEGVKGAVGTEVVVYGTGTDLGPTSVEKPMEFDPIRQHRQFCPWIISTSRGPPGWQQTLSALLRHKDHSPPVTSSTTSIIKVDDPIASVRRLFKSPSARKKVAL